MGPKAGNIVYILLYLKIMKINPKVFKIYVMSIVHSNPSDFYIYLHPHFFPMRAHQQKMKWHSQYSEHFEIQVHLFSIMQCTLAGNILSKIVFISLRDFQTWYSIPKGV